MTVDQLIQELEKLPKHMPIVLRVSDEPSEHPYYDDGSREASHVEHVGSFVLIESR